MNVYFEGVLATLGFIFSVTSSSVLKISVPIIYILQLWKMAWSAPYSMGHTVSLFR